MNPFKLPIPHPQSTLFTIRVWHETLRAESGEVRIEVKHVLSGETHYFREWRKLEEYLESKIQTVYLTETRKSICGRTNE